MNPAPSPTIDQPHMMSHMPEEPLASVDHEIEGTSDNIDSQPSKKNRTSLYTNATAKCR